MAECCGLGQWVEWTRGEERQRESTPQPLTPAAGRRSPSRIAMGILDVPRRRNRPANDILHTQAAHPRARASPRKPGDAHPHGCTCRNAYSRVTHAQSVPTWAPVISRTSGAALQVRGGTEGKGGGIEGADARQSAARSTAPRRTHAQTTSSCWNTLAPAGEA